MEPRLDQIGVVLEGEDVWLAERAVHNLRNVPIMAAQLPERNDEGNLLLDIVSSRTVAAAFTQTARSLSVWKSVISEHSPKKGTDQADWLEQAEYDSHMKAAIYRGLGDLTLICLEVSTDYNQLLFKHKAV